MFKPPGEFQSPGMPHSPFFIPYMPGMPPPPFRGPAQYPMPNGYYPGPPLPFSPYPGFFGQPSMQQPPYFLGGSPFPGGPMPPSPYIDNGSPYLFRPPFPHPPPLPPDEDRPDGVPPDFEGAVGMQNLYDFQPICTQIVSFLYIMRSV